MQSQKKEDHMPASQQMQEAATYFKALQERITEAFESFESDASFEVTPWQKNPEDQLQGYGEMRLMRGEVFEKVGVNFSYVYGTFSDEFAKQIPGALENDGKFMACGVSLVAHMKNPHAPTIHMNLRRIETAKSWFGGGIDLTPTIEYAEDTEYFHNVLKEACDTYSDTAYPTYKKWCDEYFFIKHWNEPRGVGGIFIDNLSSDDLEKDFAFIKAIGEAFLDSYLPIIEKRKDQSWSEEDKAKQLNKRAKYVEFNLLYDRGTKFGFMTGGNPEAILMSMPPYASW